MSEVYDTLAIQLPPASKEWVRDEAKRQGVSMKAVILQAIDQLRRLAVEAESNRETATAMNQQLINEARKGTRPE